MRGVLDANHFLKALYINENPSEALRYCDEQFRTTITSEDLKKMVDLAKQERGGLKSLTADSYLMEPGPTIELLYVGTYDNGFLYHRLALVGDSSSGYKVSGVWFRPDPYPQNPLRRKFEVNISVD